MKKIECEVCGSTDITKVDNDTFQCAYCGIKYSKNDVQKMLVELTKPVSVHGIAQADSILKNADMTFEQGNYKEAFDLYNQVINLDPDNERAILFRGLSSAWQSSIADCRVGEVSKAVKRAISLSYSKNGYSSEYYAFCAEAFEKAGGLFCAIVSLYESYRVRLDYYFAGNAVQTYLTGLLVLKLENASIYKIMLDDIDNYVQKSDNLSAAYISLLINDVNITFKMNNATDKNNCTEEYCKAIIDNERRAAVSNVMEKTYAREKEFTKLLSELQVVRWPGKTRDSIMDLLIMHGLAKDSEKQKYSENQRYNQYWMAHAEDKALLESQKLRYEERLNNCGAFDFQKKKELKERLAKINDELAKPR